MSTKVQREARAHLQRSGYFQPRATLVWITCPRCRGQVQTEVVAWAKPTQRQHALEAMLVEHWKDCP